jgi:hypothetical protein
MVDERIYVEEPTNEEVKLALKQQTNVKALGIGNIPPDILKGDIETTVKIMYPLFKKIWRTGKISMEARLDNKNT